MEGDKDVVEISLKLIRVPWIIGRSIMRHDMQGFWNYVNFEPYISDIIIPVSDAPIR